MTERLRIHPHALKHRLSEEDIKYAWDNFVSRRLRKGGDYWVSVGFDRSGREIELVGAILADGTILVIHAMSPATKRLKRELGLGRG